MRYDDMTKEQILAQGKMNKIDIWGRELKINFFNFDNTVDAHFGNMASMAKWTARKGEYPPLIQIMIERFKNNEGGVLRHDLLNKAFLELKNHPQCRIFYSIQLLSLN